LLVQNADLKNIFLPPPTAYSLSNQAFIHKQKKQFYTRTNTCMTTQNLIDINFFVGYYWAYFKN
jgi:hypothetical protein